MARAVHPYPSVDCIRRQLPAVRRVEGGFTLIEMMVVVVIVGILATLAVVGYRKLIQTSHVTEAANMVQSIRVAQETYHAETQQYANISASLSSFYPKTAPTGRVVTQWGGACGASCTQEWVTLPLHVDGPVMFGYATMAGPANTNPPALPAGIPSTIVLPSPSPTDWYVVTAMCDIDGDPSVSTYVMTTSWNNQVLTFNEGM